MIRKAPLWCQSSPMNMSEGEACGDAATSAGCASTIPITVCQPG